MMEFKFSSQRDIVLCCLLLHNFIRKTNMYDEGFDYLANAKSKRRERTLLQKKLLSMEFYSEILLPTKCGSNMLLTAYAQSNII
jgi:hypothetical protein